MVFSLCTWDHGVPASAASLSGSSALDGVVAAGVDAETQNGDRSVGLCGWSDASGRVTLDAAVAVSPASPGLAPKVGAVCYVERVPHPIRLARLVMERTPHLLLAGQGATEFALECGETVLPAHALDAVQEARLEEWRASGGQFRTVPNTENDHDTISIICVDSEGQLACGCTTSGLAFKRPGRVGDCPIFGAGLFCDDGPRAAVCSGVGEAVMATLGASTIVRFMAQEGLTPQLACEKYINMLHKAYPASADMQVAVLATDASPGAMAQNSGKPIYGAFSLRKGFSFGLNGHRWEAQSLL